jgi:predicted hydrocarbon binding protein
MAKEIAELTKHEEETLLRDIFDFLKAHGIGSFEYKSSSFPHGGEIAIKVVHGIEASASNMPAPRCHFTRGLLSGIISYVMGNYIPVQEVKCVGKGDRYCLFVGSKKGAKK